MDDSPVTLVFGPHELAAVLEEWAACREREADLQSSKHARDVARACRELAAGRRFRPRRAWDDAWLALLRSAATFIGGRDVRRSYPPVSIDADELESPTFDRPTRVCSVESLMDLDEPTTRVTGWDWSADGDDLQVA